MTQPPDKQTPLPSKETPVPEATVHSGLVATPRVLDGACTITARISSQSEQDLYQKGTPAIHNLALFNPDTIRIKNLPIWHHRAPMVHAPTLALYTCQIRSIPLSRPLVTINHHDFKPNPARVFRWEHQMKASTRSLKPELLLNKIWHLHAHPFAQFPTNARQYYRWYLAERLKLTLPSEAIIAVCCPLPPMPFEFLTFKVQEHDTKVMVRFTGEPEDGYRGRHGVVISEGDSHRMVRVPPPEH